MEEKIEFQSSDLKIEGLIHRGKGHRGVIITHPHPQYGGDMYNPVVESIGRVYQQKGITTLRFNFRGVGCSEGRYGDGVDERKDTLAAINWLKGKGLEEIDLAGYSFGAWVNAQITPADASIKNTTMVSPPVAFISFDANLSMPSLRLVVSGNRDEIAPADSIRNLLPGWNPKATFAEIQGADHFYFGFFNELEAILAENII